MNTWYDEPNTFGREPDEDQPGDAQRPTGPVGTSGMGVAALVLGIVSVLIGWLPGCGSVPALLLTFIGLLLGVLGLMNARGGRVGKGMPIAGLIVCGLALLIAGLSTALLAIGINSGIQEVRRQEAADAAAREALATAPAAFEEADCFEVSSASHLAGTGFLLQVDGRDGEVYAVTALHPYDDEVPETFSQLLDEEPLDDIALGRTIETGQDVRLQRLAGPAPSAAVPLIYHRDVRASLNERVAILLDDEVVEGRITREFMGFGEGEIQLATPADVMAASGSPIVLLETGTVVGVLLSADLPEGAKTIGYEELDFEFDE